MDSAQPGMNAAQQFVVVKAPLDRVYEQWSRIEDLPKFIPPLQEVRRIDDTHFSYTWHPKWPRATGVFPHRATNSGAPDSMAHNVRRFHVGRGLFRAPFSRANGSDVKNPFDLRSSKSLPESGGVPAQF